MRNGERRSEAVLRHRFISLHHYVLISFRLSSFKSVVSVGCGCERQALSAVLLAARALLCAAA
jgi:hypothetical protein